MQLPAISETWSQKPRRSLPEWSSCNQTPVCLLSSFNGTDKDIHFDFMV